MMQHTGLLWIAASLWLTACSRDPKTPDTTSETTDTPRSLVIALDGARADALRYAATPNIDSLADGSWSAGYQGAAAAAALTVPDGDTVSGPNHVAIMTGGTVEQVGVNSNDIDEMAAGDYAAFPHYLSRLEAADPALNTASLFTWGTDAFITTSADMVVLNDEDANIAWIERALAGTLEDTSAWSEDPDAIFIFLDFIDAAGHSDGFSLEVDSYVEAIERADALIGQLLDAMRDRPRFDEEDWQIIVTADHGGYETGHGGRGGHRETIPFIVTSRHTQPGVLPDGTRNLDVPPTVLAHFGIDAPTDLTGVRRDEGADVAPDIDLQQDLVASFGFDGDLTDSVGGHHAVEGASAVVAADGGRFGGHLSLSGNPAFVTLPESSDLVFTAEDAFTVALWMRADDILEGDPILIGNKDWDSGLNSGWALLANEGGDNSVGSNYGTGSDRLDVETIDYAPGEWVFVAAVFQPGGVSLTYLGHTDRRLQWVGQMTALSGSMDAGFPIRIGQDGTGDYPYSFSGDLDEVSIWRRALTHAEILALHADGAGVQVSAGR